MFQKQSVIFSKKVRIFGGEATEIGVPTAAAKVFFKAITS
jgi:hypothetical protein